MKTILGCMAAFLMVVFIFNCSGKEWVDWNEDFESGKLTKDTAFSVGAAGTTVWIVSDSERVISGKFSAYSRAEHYRGEWWEFLYSNKKKLSLKRRGSYRVTFNYKAVERPSRDGFYYFIVKTPLGGDAKHLAFTKWVAAAGAMGTKTIGFTLGDFDDYFLIWGIHKQGALSIDDIRVTELIGRKVFEEKEDFESGDFSGSLFNTWEGSGQIISDPRKIISGKFSAYGKGNPAKVQWFEFLFSDKNKLAMERKGAYTVGFKYKAVEAPGGDGFYYFVVKTPSGGNASNLAFTKWSDTDGAVGTKKIDFTLGDFEDYCLIWGIHGKGALSIDDIIVKKRN